MTASAFQPGLGVVQPGQSAPASISFTLPLLEVTSPSVTWTLLNSDGVQLASGVADGMNVAPANLGNYIVVQASLHIQVPTNLPPTLQNQNYQVLYTLTCDQLTVPALQFDSLRIEAALEHVVGAQACVHLFGRGANTAVVNYLHPNPPTDTVVRLDIYSQNNYITTYSMPASGGVVGVDGVMFAQEIDLNILIPSLNPYSLVWSVDGYTDVAGMFVINPSIQMAMKELHGLINKTNTDLQVDWVTFTPEQMMQYLVMGAGLFNAEHMPTNFTMTNAEAPVKQFWLTYAAIYAFRVQSFTGIETDFQFTGASLNVDVDRASKFQQAAETLENSIKESVRNLKVIVYKKGNNGGDGSFASVYNSSMYSIGRIGVSVNPVGRLGPVLNPTSWRSFLYLP